MTFNIENPESGVATTTTFGGRVTENPSGGRGLTLFCYVNMVEGLPCLLLIFHRACLKLK